MAKVRRCHSCGKEWLIKHEAWPQVRVLIDPETSMVHRCDPSQEIVQAGVWKGYTRREAARLWYDQKQKDKKRLDKIRKQSESPGQS